LKAEDEVCIYGFPPEWCNADDIGVIVMGNGGEYGVFWDELKMLKAYCQNHKGDFLYCRDMCVFMKDMVVENVALQPAYPKNWENRQQTKLGRMVNEALRLTDGEWNYEVRFPMLLNCEKASKLFKKFPFGEVPYAFYTLYFNYYYEKPEDVVSYNNIYCLYKNGKINPMYVNLSLMNTRWRQKIRKMYTTPSRWENERTEKIFYEHFYHYEGLRKRSGKTLLEKPCNIP
jgi:hypothetical protein